jgi:hypothetical protein
MQSINLIPGCAAGNPPPYIPAGRNPGKTTSPENREAGCNCSACILHRLEALKNR